MAIGLKERREIGKYQGSLVEEAEKLVDQAEPIWTKLEESQLRNVAGVAASAMCVPVVTNFIKYQMGRQKNWKYKDFGVKVINEMDAFEKVARRFSASQENQDEIWIELCRSFWGYVIRYMKYRREEKKENDHV